MSAAEFDFELERGGFVLRASARLEAPVTGVFGPSGAGKSTLLECLAGLARPTRGHIRIGEEVVFDSDSGVFAPPHRRGVGFVFQDARLFPHLSVAGNLRYGRRGGGGNGARFSEVVDLFELEPHLARRPTELSGGEAQRVALGRALLSGPRLLLLDEPLAALDRDLRAQILPYLQRLREATGVPVLYVSHDLSELLQQTRRLLLVERGRTTAEGELLELVRAGRIAHGNLDNVLALELERHDEEAGVSVLAAPGGARIAGALVDGSPGRRLHVGLRPEDVVLSLGRVDGISTRNQLAGEVVTLVDEGGRVLALVDAGVELLAEVTPSAVRELGLRAGRPVTCLFKANAVRYLDVLPRGA